MGSINNVSGGPGSGDRSTFDDTSAFRPERFRSWELVRLTDHSLLSLGPSLTQAGGALTLGDSGTGSGTLSIDSTSTLFAGGGTGSVLPFSGTSLATVINAGVIDLRDNGGSTTDRLAITGNYVGAGGQIQFQTVLASDGSPSDRLQINRGNASGTTTLFFTDAGGGGALTTGDGILVVEAINGATTGSAAFGGFAAAGPYDYLLERGNQDGTLAGQLVSAL